MLISVFPEIKVIKSKEDKKIFAQFGSKPHMPVITYIDGIRELIKEITTQGWSCSIFSGYRRKDNFRHCDFLALDIDDGLSFDGAFRRVKENNLMCICLPSSSNSDKLNKFRLIFPLAKRIDKATDYVHNMELLYELFPEADRQCITDEARLYFNCVLNDYGFVYEGDMYMPKNVIKVSEIDRRLKTIVPITEDIQELIKRIYGDDRDSIPKAVDYFVKNAHTGLSGEWNTSLNSFCFTLGLQEIDFDVVYQIVEELAPEELDQNDEYTINRGYQHGSESRSGVDERSGSVDRKSNIPKW